MSSRCEVVLSPFSLTGVRKSNRTQSKESNSVKEIDQQMSLEKKTISQDQTEAKNISGSLLETFRPRSKSESTKGSISLRRPNFLANLKKGQKGQNVSVIGSPLIPSHHPVILSDINENQESDKITRDKITPEKNDKIADDITPTDSNLTIKISPEKEGGEFRARAASAGHQARAHVSNIVARFRQRSNSSTQEKDKKSHHPKVTGTKSSEIGKNTKGGQNGSLEPIPRRRTSSLSTPHRGVDVAIDPVQSAILFRDARGLPATDPYTSSITSSTIVDDERQIFVKFFQYHPSYTLIPTSAKLVVFDTDLLVKKAFFALVYNGVRAAPLWDSVKQRFVGMLTITDFIRILEMNYKSPTLEMEELEKHKLSNWRDVLQDVKDLIYVYPDVTLYDAIKTLIHNKIHRLPVLDKTSGNVLYILTHKRILRFLFLYIDEMPRPSFLQESIADLKIGTFKDIEVAFEDTPIIEALHTFVQKRISAIPIVDSEGQLVNIYSRFDVINLAAEKTYSNLDVTLKVANQHRNEWFVGVHKCKKDESLFAVMERIVKAEVHRLVVVDDDNKVVGVISLSDILNYIVLRPGGDDLHSDERTDNKDNIDITDVSEAFSSLPVTGEQILPHMSVKSDSTNSFVEEEEEDLI